MSIYNGYYINIYIDISYHIIYVNIWSKNRFKVSLGIGVHTSNPLTPIVGAH